jgi:hypothetical protein
MSSRTPKHEAEYRGYKIKLEAPGFVLDRQCFTNASRASNPQYSYRTVAWSQRAANRLKAWRRDDHIFRIS